MFLDQETCQSHVTTIEKENLSMSMNQKILFSGLLCIAQILILVLWILLKMVNSVQENEGNSCSQKVTLCILHMILYINTKRFWIVVRECGYLANFLCAYWWGFAQQKSPNERINQWLYLVIYDKTNEDNWYKWRRYKNNKLLHHGDIALKYFCESWCGIHQAGRLKWAKPQELNNENFVEKQKEVTPSRFPPCLTPIVTTTAFAAVNVRILFLFTITIALHTVSCTESSKSDSLMLYLCICCIPVFLFSLYCPFYTAIHTNHCVFSWPHCKGLHKGLCVVRSKIFSLFFAMKPFVLYGSIMHWLYERLDSYLS